MEIKIVMPGTSTEGNLENRYEDYYAILNGAHAYKFTGAEKNVLYFKPRYIPHGALTRYMAAKEGNAEIVDYTASVRATVHSRGVNLSLVLDYKVRRALEGKGKDRRHTKARYTIEEKEQVFHIRATKEERVALVEPYMDRLVDANSDRTGAILKRQFMDWAHPLTLEQVIEKLTAEQREAAAELLRERFAA